MSSAAASSARLGTPSIFTRTFMLGIMGSLSMYLTSWENSDRVRDNYLDKHRDYGDTYDFIIGLTQFTADSPCLQIQQWIGNGLDDWVDSPGGSDNSNVNNYHWVGGGTAGSILANRLSEDYKCLLLEAGGDPHPFQRVPLLSNYLLQYSQLDWRHTTMPQKQAFRGSVQSRASISQGRGLGGTSNVDYMMYLRGNIKDFDNWAKLTEDSSWSYNSVLKYFKSLEQYSGPWEGEYHGDSGEMKIKQPAYTGLGERFCHAAQQHGYPQVDLNSPFVEGCDILTYPTRKGYRDSVHGSFLRKIKDSWNLAIHKYAHVNKILIKGDDNKAHGVEYDRHGKSRVAYATKEIILTAGAIQTPKLLQLSGIGERSELDSLGIPLIAELPVGKNLQDHLSVYLGPFFVDTGKSLDIDRDVSAGSALSLARDKGPLTTTGFQAAAVISSGLERLHGGRNWPDLQLTMYGLSHHKSADEDFSHAYNLKKDLLKTYFEHSKGRDSFSIVVSGGRPKSTGSVKLLNRNPYAPLIINPQYFDKIYDLVVMVDGVKKAIRLVENSTVFHDINAQLTTEILPGCETFKFKSDAYWECYIKTMSVSFGNVAGTAPMGSVLDSKMRVKGLKGLRVMDASVMPSIVSTSTGAAVMMIAEKGADLLLKEWAGSKSEGGLLKDTNLVLDKIKENASKMKGTINSSKAFLETLKLGAAASSPEAAIENINIEDLQKLTQSVGSLAAMLGSSGKHYTGRFDLGNDASLAALMTLTPKLKSQVGGLYQNLFADSAIESSIANPVSVKPEGKPSLNSFKIPLLSPNTSGKLQHQSNSLDPMKFIQGLIQNKMKDLKNITATTSVKTSTSQKSENPVRVKTPEEMTLEDIFGIAPGGQEELEDYEAEESLLLPPTTTTQKTIKTTTTQNIVKSTTTPTIVKSTTTQTTTTTTTKPTTTTTTTTTTTQPQLIEYPYEVLHSTFSTTPKFAPVYADFPRATKQPQPQPQPVVYPKPNPLANLRALEANSGPLMTPELQKLKNLEALAQIQHDTIAKFNQKQQLSQSQKVADSARLQLPFQPRQPNPLVPINPAPNPHPQPTQHAHSQPTQHAHPHPTQHAHSQPTQHAHPHPTQHAHSQMYQQQQQPSQNFPESPPIVYAAPESNYAPPLHRRPYAPLPPQYGQHQVTEPPFGFYQPPPRPSIDPTDLKFAVGSIMNAKYTQPTPNPFRGVLQYLGRPSPKELNSDGVLKALQLRANVDKYLNNYLPQQSQSWPSPIPITNIPAPPPPSPPQPIERPPPPPVPFPDMEDAGIFAPIKDALSPLTKLMRAPFDLLPTSFKNPFKKETSSDSSSSGVSSFLPQLPSLFQHRTGPMSVDSSEAQPQRPAYPPSPSEFLQPSASSSPTAIRNTLAAVLPRFFSNHSSTNENMSPELFLLTLANLTSDLPKPFVLEPGTSLKSEVGTQPLLSTSPKSEKEVQRNKKLLDQSITEILSHLKNHHFASIASNPDSDADGDDAAPSPTSGINSANEILNIQYTKVPTTVKSSAPATPKINNNPPIEFHKSSWAKEPVIPTKSLHFKIKIIK